jgi:Rps23 Pro-64 3,4-dihydroxylase Tpa1-like proline 4-hydroxylase
VDAPTSTAENDIELAPHHDVEAYAAAYAATGRVHIPNLLRESDARRLHDVLARRIPWDRVVIYNGNHQFPLSQWEAMSSAQRRAMEESFVKATGQPRGFQARFLSMHLSRNGEPFEGGIPELTALTRFINGEAFLSLARTVTGDDQVRLADAQASCYRAGDFLHRHCDDIDPEHAARVAAYVINLTPDWLPEWGGLLNFLRPDGHIDAAFTPKWNAINFLKVPQMHFVNVVASFATRPRLSVSGWVRKR